MSNILTEKLLVAGLVQESVTDGPGVRFVIFTQGCPHHCPGCHNPETHPIEGCGTLFSIGDLFSQIQKNGLLSGVTFSGGEPFLQARRLAELARLCHGIGKNVVVFTGYEYEKLRDAGNSDWDALLAETDILIDGPYLQEEQSLNLLFRGSRNQRIIDLALSRGEPSPKIPGALLLNDLE